jgi:sugar-specific transcriptional regulator TrmB
MNDSLLLDSVGLNPRQLETYTALLKLGAASIRQIAAASGINRGSTYEDLKQLMAVGLVSFHHNGTRQKFFAEPPEKMYDLLAQKHRDLELAEEKAAQLIRQLTPLQDSTTEAPIIRFYEGDEGVAAILRDVLMTMRSSDNKEYFAYSSRPLRQYIYRLFPNFTRQRIKEGIKVRVIAIGEGGELAGLDERKWMRDTTGPGADVSSYSLIYGDKVAFIALSANNTPHGVIVHEPGMASMQRLLFEQLWRAI